MENMIKEAIARLANGENIGYEAAKEVMNEIMSGEASDIQKSAYLTALSMKGETIEEITGSAEEMRNHCVRLLNDMDDWKSWEPAGINPIPLIFPQPRQS